METNRMPALFIGHGSPMNAIEDNEYNRGWAAAARDLPRPATILCISAHWETRGSFVTAEETPRTIHDFGGFPRALYEMQYPAPGLPEMAGRIAQLAPAAGVQPATNWGLDHGTWSVLCRMYPQADIPVVQLSLDRSQDATYHYQLGRQLNALRDEGVLIIGSGNMVHNLGLVAWDHVNTPGYAYDWAIEADAAIKKSILGGDHAPLINYQAQGRAFRLAIPTPEHFIPLLYSLALQEKDEPVELFNDKPVGGSLTMTSVKIG